MQAITEQVTQLMQDMPDDMAMEILHYVEFMAGRYQHTPEDARWDKAFANTNTAKLQAWLDAERASDTELTAVDDSGEVLNPQHEIQSL